MLITRMQTERSNISSLDRIFILGVSQEEISTIVNDIMPFIAKGVERIKEKHNVDSILELLFNGNAHLWVLSDGKCIRGILITEFIRYPLSKWLNIIMLVGNNIIKNISVIRFIEKFAKNTGCLGIEALARKGFKKFFDDYRVDHQFYEKVLL